MSLSHSSKIIRASRFLIVRLFTLLTLLSVASALWVILLGGPPAQAEHFFNEIFSRPTNVKVAAFHSEMLNRQVHYSVYLPPCYYAEPDRRFPVIYYFHGFDARGTAYEDWINWRLDEALDELITAGQAQEMIVVAPECFSTGIVVDWGRAEEAKLPAAITFPFRLVRGGMRSLRDSTYLGTYLFIHKNDLTRSAYADFITTEFINHVEQNYRVRPGKRFRAVSGFSTGGYSALSIAMQNPHLFDSVSAHAPMLVSGSLFAADAGERFVEFDSERGRYLPQRFTINLLRRIFLTDETWRANNPIDLARSVDLAKMAIYIDVADGDKRKYDAGAKELVDVLEDRGVEVEFEVVSGLPAESSHTYPGFLNGRLIAARTEGLSEQELRRLYRWKNLNTLINPQTQQIKRSLVFHSKCFSEE